MLKSVIVRISEIAVLQNEKLETIVIFEQISDRVLILKLLLQIQNNYLICFLC